LNYRGSITEDSEKYEAIMMAIRGLLFAERKTPEKE